MMELDERENTERVAVQNNLEEVKSFSLSVGTVVFRANRGMIWSWHVSRDGFRYIPIGTWNLIILYLDLFLN
jgi:hypothetical protein